MANGRKTFAIALLNSSYTAWTREEVSQRRRPTRRIQNRLDTQLDMKKVTFYSKPLDDSNGTTKNEQNKAMQPASQTTESPETAKKHLGLLAVLAIGVDAAASFLKAKMEKAAAVASKVGAAILKSKKAVSSTAPAVLARIRPELPKKARLAVSAFLLASIITPQLNAWINLIYLPVYERVHYVKVFDETYREGFQHRWKIYGYYYSEYFSSHLRGLRLYGGAGLFGYATKQTDILVPSIWRRTDTIYLTDMTYISQCFAHNSEGEVVSWICQRSFVELIPHKKIGRTDRLWKSDHDLSYYDSWKWRDYYFSIAVPETEPGRLGPDKFQVQFQSPRYNGESLPLPAGRRCVSHEFPAFPGPLVFINPCIPSNMSVPENGYIDYEGACLVIFAPNSDDDE